MTTNLNRKFGLNSSTLAISPDEEIIMLRCSNNPNSNLDERIPNDLNVYYSVGLPVK